MRSIFVPHFHPAGGRKGSAVVISLLRRALETSFVWTAPAVEGASGAKKNYSSRISPCSLVLSHFARFISVALFSSSVALLLVFSALSSCFWPVFSSMALFSALLVSQQQQKNRRGKYPDGSSSFCSCLILCFTRFAPLCAALSVLCVRCSSCLARLFGVALCVRHVCVVCSVRCAGRAMHCAGI